MTATLERPTLVHPGRFARVDDTIRLGVLSLVWLGTLLVTYWWLRDGGVQALSTFGGALTSIGRLTGLVGTFLLLVQVMAMARIPVVERAFGQDRLAHLHRLLGFTSFDLIVAHVLLTTWGYADGSLGQLLPTGWDLTIHYPGMLIAMAGTLFMVLVVVTSIRASRRRLRYESWHLIHLYGYLGAGLAVPHQLWTGQEFLTSKPATVFWWGLWILAGVAALVYRVALPLARTLRHRITVDRVVDEGDGVVSVHLAGRDLHKLHAEAGQFFVWRFLRGEGRTRGNPFSLSAAPTSDTLRISVKDLGDRSAALRTLEPGTRVLIEGPYGRLSGRARTRHKVAFIGAGVGTTPLRALAEGLDYAPGDAVFLNRFRDRPLFGPELLALEQQRGLRMLWLPGRRRSTTSWLGEHAGAASDVQALRHWVPDVAERDVYVCGPEVWTSQVLSTLREAGVPAAQVHVERFGW